MVEDKRNIKAQKSAHNLILENREKLSLSGVLDVESFDEESIILHTDMGILIIKGDELHINKLNIDSSEIIIEGSINSCNYADASGYGAKGIGLFGKLF